MQGKDARLGNPLRRGGAFSPHRSASFDVSISLFKTAEVPQASRPRPAVIHRVAAAAPMVRDASRSEQDGWDDLVGRFENCEFAQKQAWIRSLEASGLGRPLYLVFESGGRVVGCISGLLVRKGPLRIFGSPLPGWQSAAMGPAFDPGAVSTREIMPLLVDHLEVHHGVHHMELISGALDEEAMRAYGFRGAPVMTFRCPLYRDEAAQMKALKDSARRNIRRAARLGIVVRLEDDERFVDEHYDQVKEVFRRGGNTVPFAKRRALSYFRHMKASGALVAVAAYLPDDTCIATGMFAIDGKELQLWTWTHRTQHRWYRPTELMTWTVMRHAAARGCETFDLMGRGDFKTRFGASLDGSKVRWVRSRYAWLTRLRDLAEMGYRGQQAVRGRMARNRDVLLERFAAWRFGKPAEAMSNGGDE